MSFFEKNYLDFFAFIIFVFCLAALIFKNDIASNISQTLTYIATASFGFMFRGKIKD